MVRSRRTAAVPSSPLSATDATLWEIERDPRLRTTIVVVLWLDRPIDVGRLRNDLEATTRDLPRLRQRVRENLAGIGTPHWEIDPDFDIDNHLRFIDAPSGADLEVVLETAGELAGSAVDRAGPLWSAIYVGGEQGSAAIIMQVHHSLTDGVGGVALLDTMLDSEKNTEPRDLADTALPVAAGWLADARQDAERSARDIASVSRGLGSTVQSMVTHPGRTTTDAWSGARSAVRLLKPTSDPLSKLLSDRGEARQVLTTEIDLERLHEAASRQKCTINHAFIAGVVAGVAAYHEALGGPVEQLRVLMPVDARTASDGSAGNHWAPVNFVVPADISDPVARMKAMRDRVATARSEPALGITKPIAGLVQTLPSAVSSSIVGGMTHGIDLAITDIPGLTEQRYISGAEVERIIAFAPTGGAAINVSLLSHLSNAEIGITADVAAIADPKLLRDLIAEHLELTVAAAEAAPQAAVDDERTAARPSNGQAEPERLSALDTSFLRIESRGMPMHIGGVAIVEGGPLRDEAGVIRLEAARRHIEARLPIVPRFRRRLSEVPLGIGRPIWVDDVDFDISRHVRLTSIAQPGEPEQLLDLTALLHEQLIDRRHPLWEIWLVDGLADGRVGIIDKVHHSLVDGIGGVELLLALFDAKPSGPLELPSQQPPTVVEPGEVAKLRAAVMEQVVDPIDVVRQSIRSWRQIPGRIAEAAKGVVESVEVLRPSIGKQSAPFNGAVGPRRALRSVTTSLDVVNEARADTGATINDVVLATIAGALGRWFDHTGHDLADIGVAIPVSTRSDGTEVEPGNRVGLMMVALPVGEPDARRRLSLVMDRVKRAKSAHEAEGMGAMIDALDHAPAPTIWVASGIIAAQPFSNLVVTNVPGPPIPLYFLGARIEEMVPIVPLAANMGLGIAVLSYAGQLTISIFADPEMCRSLDFFGDAVLEDLAEIGAV